MRIIGFDIHRAFAEAVAWEDGKLRRLGRVEMRRNLLTVFATTLSCEDIVVIKATGNAAAVASVIGPHVKRVVIANPIQVRITKRGRGHPAACWSRRLGPPPVRRGPLTRFLSADQGEARATCGRLAVLIWYLLHKKESYAWARPALQARKIRKLEFKAGHKARRGQKGSAHAYNNIKGHREQERRFVE